MSALYESYIDCYDEIINETLKISFEITKEISDLRIAESFNEALVGVKIDRPGTNVVTYFDTLPSQNPCRI